LFSLTKLIDSPISSPILNPTLHTKFNQLCTFANETPPCHTTHDTCIRIYSQDPSLFEPLLGLGRLCPSKSDFND